MLTYTVKQANGFHGGTCESFQHIVRDGRQQVNGTTLHYGRLEPLSTETGHWKFFANGVLVYEVDLDDLNAAS